MRPPTGEEAPGTVRERLELVYEWYRKMLSPDTGRLVYRYDPETGDVVANGSAIRDIASVWDLEQLGEFLGRHDLALTAERSLRHYLGMLEERDGARFFDSSRLGEPAGIAHAAFLLLAVLGSSVSGRDRIAGGLAEAILRQQRPDGSYRIYFGPEPDDGIEFYPGEAMLALLTWDAGRPVGRGRLHRSRKAAPIPPRPPTPGPGVASAARAFEHYRKHLPPGAVSDGLVIFYGNWVAQYGGLLHAATSDPVLQEEVSDYVFALHDRIVARGFYEEISRRPVNQATVEVGCALEGVVSAYELARRVGDERRAAAYAGAAQRASAWLRDAQCLHGCTPREYGGFGDSRLDRRQRIDVTGHVLNGWIRACRCGLEA
jgi:hypothetical protein